MDTAITNATKYRDVPLALLTESTTNPRRIFEEGGLQELADYVPGRSLAVTRSSRK
jgi:ParB family chromosome partitioning protein